MRVVIITRDIFLEFSVVFSFILMIDSGVLYTSELLQEVRSDAGELRSDCVDGLESQTTLVYVVHVKPKVWLPVRLVEGRLCNEIRTNLSCIREEAEKVFQNANSVVIED